MRIALLGATGRTGRPFIDLALAAGHTVVAYARRPEALEPRPGLSVVGGELTDVDRLTAAVTGCDAVVVALGPHGERPTVVMRTAVPVVTAAMRASGVRRLVVLSALGAGPTLRQSPPAARFIARTVAASIYADHTAAEAGLPVSGLDWTLVYPGRLLDGEATGTARTRDLAVIRRVRGIPRITYADLAAVLLDVVADDTTIRRRLYAG